MRRSGLVQHARDLGSHDHVCWRFEDMAEFQTRAAEFLVDGLRSGHQVRYLGSGDARSLRDGLGEVDELAGALRDGTLLVSSVDDQYPTGSVITPEEQVRTYAAATEEALAAGFTGLRVAADCTSLVRTPEQIAAFAAYEHRMDRYMATRPFSAMCGYDVSRLDADAVAQLACMHPGTNTAADSGFRLHGTDRAGCAVALSGELDKTTVPAFAAALERADPRGRDGELVIDGTGLTFIDHNSMLRLAAHARRRSETLVLRTEWSGAPRIVAALGIAGVRVERST